MRFKRLVSQKAAPWLSAGLIIASTFAGVVAGNLGGESESCVIRSELTERFGTKPYEFGLSATQLTYEASIYAELARLAPDIVTKREYSYLATMKVNTAIDEVMKLTLGKGVAPWRFPSDLELNSAAYHDAFFRRLDQLKVEQLRLTAKAFDTDLPRDVKLQEECNRTGDLRLLWSFLTGILAIASIVFVTMRERTREV